VTSNKQEEGEFNRQQWTDTSLLFIKECVDHLHGSDGRIALKYLREKRGLDDDILEQWNIGYNPIEGYGDPVEWGFSVDHPKIPLNQGITIPCQDDLGLHYIKIRRRTSFSHDERYKIITGGNNWLYGSQTCKDTVYALLFEGEFSVLLSLRTGFTGIGYISLPAKQHLREEYDHYLNNLENLILAQDFDEAGEKAASEMLKLSPSQFHRAIPLPSGKDIGEYYLASNSSLEAVFEWLYSQLGLLSNENKP